MMRVVRRSTRFFMFHVSCLHVSVSHTAPRGWQARARLSDRFEESFDRRPCAVASLRQSVKTSAKRNTPMPHPLLRTLGVALAAALFAAPVIAADPPAGTPPANT